MKRTDSDGATIDLKFTNGNPSLGIPATTVDDNWLNTVQEEIALFIESQGITLDQTGTDVTQLQQALGAFVGGGGVSIPDFSIENDISTAADVTSFTFNSATTKAARVLFDLERRTDDSSVVETGEIFLTFDSENLQWKLSLDSKFDDAGVVFSVTTTDQGGPGPYVAQVQYTSSDLTGAGYVGTLKLKNVITVNA